MTDFTAWRYYTRKDGAGVLYDPADPVRRLIDYGEGVTARYAICGTIEGLPTVPHSRNERQEAENQRERNRQLAVIAGAFERARGEK